MTNEGLNLQKSCCIISMIHALIMFYFTIHTRTCITWADPEGGAGGPVPPSIFLNIDFCNGKINGTNPGLKLHRSRNFSGSANL